MKNLLKIYILIIVLLSSVYPVYAAAPTKLSWNASTGTVSGYKIYYGTSSGVYSAVKDVGNVTQYLLSNFTFTEGTTYYFVVKAYNDTIESSSSNEVTYCPDSTSPAIAITFPTTSTPYTTTSNTITISGTASDNVGISSVAWVVVSSGSGSGGTANGTKSWTVSGISLQSGTNTITMTAYDKAGNSSQKTLTVIYSTVKTASLDTTAPAVIITSPTKRTSYSSRNPTVNLAGIASDSVGVTKVTWANAANGTSGIATGTTNWLASNVTLIKGKNVVTVTVYDAAGNSSTANLSITRRR